MRMRNEEQEFVISKFNRHGLRITPKSLEKTVGWLKQRPNGSIDILLKKLGQLALQNSSIDENVQHAIQILSMKNKNLSTYDDLLQETRKKCIYALSPYEKNNQTFFAQRPNPSLFQFKPEQKQKNHLNRFKRITDSNKDIPRDCVIGAIFQNFSSLTNEGKPKIILQNEVNQVELSFPKDFNPGCVLYSGCAYIAKGKQQGKDLCFKVQKMILPSPPLQDKNSLLKMKFKQMCQNVSSAKQSVGYEPYDFVKYDCVLNPSFETKRASLIFGNITINKESVARIKRLTDAYPSGISCVFLMLSAETQEQIDLSLWLKCKVFIIPHIASDGPRLLPKLPLLKNRIPGAKVLTNPAKISLQGKQFILANYPLVRSILTQRISAASAPQLGQNELLTKVSDLIFSQGTIALGFENYWPQTQYFNIHSESIVVVTDGVAGATYQKRQKAKIGGLSNTGNFDRDGDFLCVMAFAKEIVQPCGQM